MTRRRALSTWELEDDTYALLNDRHLAVLGAMLEGPTDAVSIARRLNLSPSYVRGLLSDIRTELGAQSKTEALVMALRAGMVTL